MSRNIVPRANKDADLGTPAKNWNKLYADTVVLRGNDLHALLDGKTDLNILTAKGDLYVATDAGIITRLPAGEDGYVLKSNSAITEGLMWGPAGARQELTGDITVTVGDGGDFPTINAALENIVALYYPKYISGGNCPRVTIHLLPGFVMSEQVLIESLDLSWITIKGEDSETVINQNALTKAFGDGSPAFAAINGGFLPIISQLFNMDGSSSSVYDHGIVIRNNSRTIISSGCGIKNASGHGLYVIYNSIVNANGAVFISNRSYRNIAAFWCSIINANNADASGAVDSGFVAQYGSIINANNADASGAGSNGFFAQYGSIINANNADASGAGLHSVISASGSIVNASNVNGLDSGNAWVTSGSIINANGLIGTLSQPPNVITNNGIIFQAT